MFKTVVVPTGRTTKEGKTIFKQAPSKSDIKRAVSAKRVQKFGSGGRKISDTQRVKVTIGGVTKFVTPERALELSKEGSRQFIEAQQKQAEIQRLTQEAIKQAGFDIKKITARGENQRQKVAKLIIAEQRARGTAAESLFKQRRIEEQAKLSKIEREKAVIVRFSTAAGKAIVQVQVFPRKIIEAEEARQKKPLELFTPKAREQLGLTETTQGLLQIPIGDRKLVVEKGVIRADIPTTAEFTKGFEKFLGTGEFPSDFEKALRVGGLFAFGGRIVSGKQLLGAPKKAIDFLQTKVSPITTRIFRTEDLEQQQKRIRAEINKLEGKTNRSSVIQRRLLKGELVSISSEIGIRKQFGEQTIETGLFFGAGALVTKGIALTGLIGKPITKIATGVLGTLFVGGTALEIKKEIELEDIGAGAELFGERLGEITAFVSGGAFVTRFGIKPKKVKVLKAKEIEGQFAETLDIKGTSAKNLQRLGLKTETKVRVTRTDVKGFTKRIKIPKDQVKLAKLLEDQRVRFEFGFDPKTGQVKQFLVRDVGATVRRFDIRPEAFEISIDGRIGIRSFTTTQVKDVKGIRRIIEPTKFDLRAKGDLTILERIIDFKTDFPGLILRAELGGKARITGKVKPVKQIVDIFGIDLFAPQVVTDFTGVTTRLGFKSTLALPFISNLAGTQSIRLGFKPILAVTPIFEPPTPFVFPTFLFDFDREGKRAIKRDFFFDVDTVRDFRQDLIGLQEQVVRSRQKQKPILEQITEQQQRITTLQKPIVDVFGEQEQLPVVDVIQVQEQKLILDVRTDLRQDLIIKQVTEPTQDIVLLGGVPRRKKPKKIIKGRFEGYNSFVRGKGGKQLKVNLKRTLTKKSALSTSARVVDTSLSASGSIKKVASKNPPVDTKDNYFQNNRNKFRTFKIRKGKRIPLKNRFIELRGKRLDTPQEVNKIQAARRISQVRKKLLKFEIFEEPKRKKRRRTARFF